MRKWLIVEREKTMFILFCFLGFFRLSKIDEQRKKKKSKTSTIFFLLFLFNNNRFTNAAFGRSRSRGSFSRRLGSQGEEHQQQRQQRRDGSQSPTRRRVATSSSSSSSAPALLPPPLAPLPPPPPPSSKSKPQPQTKHRRKLATVVMMNLAMAFERTDEVVLPAVYSFVAASFGANLLQLSYLTLARALTQALLSPLGGWLGHAFNRVAVLTLGCAIWGAAMSAFAFATTLGQGVACWALTGAGLCIVVPNAQSLTADLHAEHRRGAAFGTLHLTSALGAALGGLYATNVGASRPLGWDGWRVAMLLLGAAALAIGAANALVSADPRAMRGSRWRLAPEEVAGGEDEGGAGTSTAAAATGSNGGSVLPLESLEGNNDDEEEGGRGRGRGGMTTTTAVTAAAASQEQDEEEDEGVVPLAVAPKGRQGAVLSSSSSSSSPPPPPSVITIADVAEVPPPSKPPSFLSDFAAVLRVPTFVIIVAQGIVGNVPMAALAFQTLYLQLLGIPSSWASAAVSAGFGAHALGGLIGGALGDAAARWSPRHGRVLVCQASVVLGALATLLMLRGLPRGYYEADSATLPPPPTPPPILKSRAAAAVPLYVFVFVVNGLVNAWPAPACNNPIFAEIVPARSRTLVYAFDRSFEMAVAALVGGPLVSLVAMKLFGFSDGDAGASGDPRQDGPKAEALSAALAASTAVPWAACALLYNGVHCTYARDKARVAARAAAERRSRSSSTVGGGGVVGVGGVDIISSSNNNSSLRSPPPPPQMLQRSGSIDGRPGDRAPRRDDCVAAAGVGRGGKKRGGGGGGGGSGGGGVGGS